MLCYRSSPDELLSRLEKVHISRTVPTDRKETGDERKFSPVAEPKPATLSPTNTKQKLLKDVMKLDLVADKTADEIKKVWF